MLGGLRRIDRRGGWTLIGELLEEVKEGGGEGGLGRVFVRTFWGRLDGDRVWKECGRESILTEYPNSVS